jgi:crotonobetainyl-CoA:carnitine CoA-transferase CaiB-like acyl-CoA transferase
LGQEFPREIRAEAGNPVYNHYACKDGKWLVLAHLDPDRYWPKVCKALGMEDLENDPKFNTIPARSKHAKELVGIMDKRFATKTRDEWVDILQKEGCIFTPIQSPTEVSNDPQAMANNYFIECEHPEHGKTKMVGFPWDFSETPAQYRRPAPGLGEHTTEILEEIGYSKEEIAVYMKTMSKS